MKQFIKLSVIACLVAVMSGCKDNDEEAPYFKIGSQSLTQVFGPEGGTKYFTVSTNRKFTATASESWCTATVTEGKTEENIEIKVSPLQATTGRQATVTIACAGFASQLLTVTQTGVEITFEVTPPENRTAVAWQGENVVFTVNSSETWAYEITPNSGWLTEGPKDAATLTLIAAANSGAARNAAVRFFLPAYSEVSEEIVITQMAQGEITLSVSPEKTSIIPKGGGDADVITVTTDANEWNYTAPAWLRESGKTATTLTLTASAAPLGSRIGVVTITAGDKSRQVEVIQRGLADIMDLIFNADGTATNIADPELPVITTPYVKTGETDIDRLTTVKSETYGRYIARFAHTDWVSGYLTPTGFYRLEYGTVADKLTNGHSMEALVSSNVLKDNAKALGGHQGGGVALYFGSGASSGKFTYQAHIGPGYRGPIAPSAAVAGTYYHLVGVYNPSTGLSLYINGELVATHSETSTAMVLSSNENNRWLGIGADTGENKGGENGWDGDIAIARVYDALLTPEQVAALYAEINE